jgi:hypothetical protein
VQVPEQVRAGAARVLGHQMAAGLEQAAALDRKQRVAADRQLGAELLEREPGVRGGRGSRGCRRWGSGGDYPGVEGAHTLSIHGVAWG